MTKAQAQIIRDALAEARHEITRLNRAAGETVFNPAATQAIDAAIESLEAEAA